MPLRAATFKVTDYGAVGDDNTDNTAAFTACLNAVIAAGG
jgi:polygalacturonase